MKENWELFSRMGELNKKINSEDISDLSQKEIDYMYDKYGTALAVLRAVNKSDKSLVESMIKIENEKYKRYYNKHPITAACKAFGVSK